MLFNDQIKQHWLDKIEELGDYFDPDCGNSKYGLKAAPFCLLTNLYGDQCLWASYEKEFQLPRWILEVISTHMHEVSPATSKEDLKRVFEACPTYTDLDLLYHKFSKEVLLYLLRNFSDIPAQLQHDKYYTGVWAHLLTNEMLMSERKVISGDAYIKMEEIEKGYEYWGMGGNRYQYTTWSKEAIIKRYTGKWVEYIHMLHGLKGGRGFLRRSWGFCFGHAY